MRFPPPLEGLIEHFKKFPGVGRKTAERYAFELLHWKEREIIAFGSALTTLTGKVAECTTCRVMGTPERCLFCHQAREKTQLVVAASSRDVYAIEGTQNYHGLYYVIETLINPLEGKMASYIDIKRLIQFIDNHGVRDVTLAFDSTIEADTTALYLKQSLSPHGVILYRLAFGIPVGSSLEYVDEGTLSRALSGRQKF